MEAGRLVLAGFMLGRNYITGNGKLDWIAHTGESKSYFPSKKVCKVFKNIPFLSPQLLLGKDADCVFDLGRKECSWKMLEC